MSTGGHWPRVVVDTSTVVSGVVIRRGPPQALVDAWYEGRLGWLITPALAAEYAEVLHRHMLLASFRTSLDEVDAFLRLVALLGKPVTPAVALPLRLGDPNDDMVLAAALGGAADVLVTGDNDLLSVAGDPSIAPLWIAPVAEFMLAMNT